MNNTCATCGNSFEVNAADRAFYEKISPVVGGKTLPVPPPTRCPDCRQQRRLAWRNEHTFYRSTCKNCGRAIVSILNPGGPYSAFCHECWFSDSWDAKEYGRDINFSRPFFEQMREMNLQVPQLALSIWNSENSNYCNYVGDVKNSYLIFGSVYSQDCYYGSPYYSTHCVDTLVVRTCERCYECIDCRELYECSWCQDCHGSSQLLFCYDLQGCTDCIGCAGLRRKKHCIFNKQLSPEDYAMKAASLNISDPIISKLLRSRLAALKETVPHRFMQSAKAENVSGNFVYECRNVHDAYYADRSEDCRYAAQVVDLKDCHDINFTEEDELCYEYLGAYQNSRTAFSLFCNRLSEALYCNACHRSQNIFGCAGLRSASYCILNKQYTKDAYEKLVPKLVAHMQETGEWGEFFPIADSPFGYNETVASEYFPLPKAAVERHGWKWCDDLPHTTGKETVQWKDLPASSIEASDTITQEVLACTACQRNFRLIPQELAFYRSMKLPIPQRCFDCRHLSRIAQRNPRKLWNRQCVKCAETIATSYQPSRPEIVYCERCYLNEMY